MHLAPLLYPPDVCVLEFEDDQEYHLEVEQLEEECPGIADTVLTELSGPITFTISAMRF